MTRVSVPEGQTPLDDKLNHRLLDVLREGREARENGTGSPYHGHSLEHCLHATGWVQHDLRMALDRAQKAANENYREPGDFGEGATVRRAEPTGTIATQEFTLKAMAVNYRDGHSWDHLDSTACALAAAEINMLRETLRKIAAYDDAAANAYLRATGSYRCFDEPGAVEMARGVLEGGSC